ncbi:MAG: metallophosphoesterase [Clostridia bacterium]|nr:metallophosphoesterase [Clostridia bacterium]
MKKRILSLLMACMMVVSTFIISRPLVDIHAAETDSGISFTTSEFYQATDVLTALPQTFEATIKLPSTQTARAGVVLSTYQGADNTALAIEVYSNGNPRFFLQKSNWADDIDVKFTDVNVATGEWVHLVITRDIANKTLKCYVDGVLKQTVTYTEDYVETNKIPYYIGGDARDGNSQYFKGQIKDVAVYSDLRTAAEIASDVNGIGYTDANLLFAHDFTVSGNERLKDYSNNRNHLVYTNGSTTETYEDPGLTFTQTEFYQSEKDVGTPRTIEATFSLDANATNARLGAIVGNFSDYKAGSFGLEIRDNYTLSLWWEPTGGSGKAINFTSFCDTLKASRGKKVHVAVTFADNVATLYVNGEYFDKVTATTSVDLTNNIGSIRIGGDYRANNIRYLQQAKVYSVALYSDVRSETEIAADVSAVDTKDANLLCSYDFNVTGNDRLKDYSKNENHLSYSNGTAKEEYAGNTGISFEKNNLLHTDAPLTAVPQTIEAYVYVPSSVGSNRIGVIYGNYKTSGVDCVSMEVLAGGKPRFYWQIGSKAYDYQFSNVNIINNCWTHVTLVRDIANSKAHCYINGELVQSVNISDAAIESGYTTPICIGGDLRGGNSCSFLGKIRSIIAYSDVRSADEIKADYTAVAPDYNDTALIAHYDLSELINVNGREGIEDLTENGNDVYTPWIVNNDVNDYSYTFAVVGDTQKVSDYDLDNGTQLFAKIYDYILNNIDKQNVKLVIGLGDITENWGSYDSEWELAQENIFKLNGKVPYILNRGNHDPSNKFNAYFNNTAYSEQLEGTYDGNIDNSYFTLTVGEIKYLVMALDYGPSDAVLSWAAGVVDSHPEHNVIITTHAYMYRDGTTLDQGDVCPPATTGGYNNGDDVWEKFVKNHENIVLVLSGHDPWDKIVMREDDGVNGNKVVQMLIDPQGMDANAPVGMVAMFHFSEDGKTVQVEYYSTVEEKWYHPDNQFTFTLDVVKPCDHEGLWENGVCSNCGEVCPGHTGGKATCQKGAVCEICGKEYTEKDLTNHVSNEFIYTEIDGVTHKVAYKCCGTEAPDGDCVYGNDNICDYCGYDKTVEVETEDVKNAIDNILNGGTADVTVVGPTTTMDEAFVVEKIENVVGYEYKYFNVDFDANGNVILRNHFIVTGELPTVTLNGEEVALKQDEGYNTYYLDITPVAGEYDVANVVTVNGDTYNVSLYSYIKLALEGTDVDLTDAEETLLRALYDLNEAYR